MCLRIRGAFARMETPNIPEEAALASCPSQSSLPVEGKYFTHADPKKLNHCSWGEREEADTVNTFFFKYYKSLGDQSPMMQCCNKLCFCLECAVSVLLSVHVRACASLRHRHNSTSVQVSCFPGSRTAPAQPVQAGCVTQSLWTGERLSGGREPGHGERGVSGPSCLAPSSWDQYGARSADGELLDLVAAPKSSTGSKSYLYHELSHLAVDVVCST